MSFFVSRTFASQPHSFAFRKFKRAAIATSAITASVLLTAYVYDCRAAFHQLVSMPFLRYLDPEDAHDLAVTMIKHGLSPKDKKVDDSLLATTIWNKKLSNPIGFAAGFDKHGEAMDGLFDLGFGMVEIGSVTPLPQPGNPKPRMFRLLKDEGIINRYGFNSEGHEKVLERLQQRIRKYVRWYRNVPENKSLRNEKLLGINLGKNKTSEQSDPSDYVKGIETFEGFADYLVVNVSSPNTPGLRGMQRQDILQELVRKVKVARKNESVPIVLKIAPDLNEEQMKQIAEVAMKEKIDGIIVSNTTVQRPALNSDEGIVAEIGGLSGKPLKQLSLEVLSKMYKFTDGTIPLIGCGGISSGKDAIEFAKHGATLVQVFSGLVYKGCGLGREIKDQIVEILKTEGKTWQTVVGEYHRE